MKEQFPISSYETDLFGLPESLSKDAWAFSGSWVLYLQSFVIEIGRRLRFVLQRK